MAILGTETAVYSSSQVEMISLISAFEHNSKNPFGRSVQFNEAASAPSCKLLMVTEKSPSMTPNNDTALLSLALAQFPANKDTKPSSSLLSLALATKERYDKVAKAAFRGSPFVTITMMSRCQIHLPQTFTNSFPVDFEPKPKDHHKPQICSIERASPDRL